MRRDSLFVRRTLVGAVVTLVSFRAGAQAPRSEVGRVEIAAARAAITYIEPTATLAAAAPSPGRALAGALLGGAAGTLVGGIAGLYIGGSQCVTPGNGESCHGLDGMLIGAGLGFTVGAPIGAHLLNHRRGALPYSVLTSAAIAAAGTLAFRSVDRHASGTRRTTTLNALVISVPVLQIVSATLIEARSSRR